MTTTTHTCERCRASSGDRSEAVREIGGQWVCRDCAVALTPQLDLEVVASALRDAGWEAQVFPRYQSDIRPGFLNALTPDADAKGYEFRLDDDGSGFIHTSMHGGYHKSIDFDERMAKTFLTLANARLAKPRSSIVPDTLIEAARVIVEGYYESGVVAGIALGRMQDLENEFAAYDKECGK